MSIPEFFAEVPVAGPTAPDRIRPYGLFGLILSTAGILVLGALIMAVLAVVWIAVAGLAEVESAMGSLSGIDINELRVAPYRTQIVMYGVTAASFIGFGLAVLAFARLRGGANWRIPLAWEAPSGWPTGKWLVLLPVFALVYLLTAGFGIKLIFPDFRTWFFIPPGGWGMALSFVTVVLLAPWAEELLFRGWIYSSLRQSFGVWAGLIVVALLFALAHLDKTGLYPVLIFIPGLVLTLIREKNGSSKASFYAHAAYNCLAWLIVFFVGNP